MGPSVSSGRDVEDDEEAGEEQEGALGELHELFGTAILLLVGMHVAYLIVFRRDIALKMLFVRGRSPA